MKKLRVVCSIYLFINEKIFQSALRAAVTRGSQTRPLKATARMSWKRPKVRQMAAADEARVSMNGSNATEERYTTDSAPRLRRASSVPSDAVTAPVSRAAIASGAANGRMPSEEGHRAI